MTSLFSDDSNAAAVWSYETVNAPQLFMLYGDDARAFLHRMSTNAIKDAGAGTYLLNTLTTDKGRIVDVIQCAVLSERHILLLTSTSMTADDAIAWLDRYLFIEKVELFAVPSVARWVSAPTPLLYGQEKPLDKWSASRWPHLDTKLDLQQEQEIIWRTFDAIDGNGQARHAYWQMSFRLPDAVLPADAPFVKPRQALQLSDVHTHAAWASLPVHSFDDTAFQAMRIAAGIPARSGEIGEQHNPLDLALHDAIHWAKGCYIGQEVIARLDTYGKHNKQLVAWHLPEEVRAQIQPKDMVLRGAALVGEVTSVAPKTWGHPKTDDENTRTDARANTLAVVKMSVSEGDWSIQRPDGSTLLIDAAAWRARLAAQEKHD